MPFYQPRALRLALTTALAMIAFASPRMQAQSRVQAATPPMGWNSWNHFAEKVTDADVRAAADAMVASGMQGAGYVYVNIDDGWQGERNTHGNIQANRKFPDMKALADYVHANGLKLGIYSSPGPKTCGGFEGSYGHEEQDANTYANWGVDYLKYDLCSFEDIMKLHDPAQNPQQANAMMKAAYKKMHEALADTHRPIVYSLCQYGVGSVWEWGPSVGANLWRTTDDIRDTYRSMALIGFSQEGLERFAGPGHWNDPDMLEIGNGGMNADQYRTQMSLWAILAAPLVSIHRQSRWLYGCWPLKGAFSQPSEAKARTKAKASNCCLHCRSTGISRENILPEFSKFYCHPGRAGGTPVGLAGNDLSKLDDTTKSILINKEVIAVDQDKLGVQGHRIGPPQIWVKPMSGGAKAVAIFNYVTDDEAEPLTLLLKDVGFTGPVHVRDLWAHKDLGILRDSYTVTVPQGGVVMLRMWQ